MSDAGSHRTDDDSMPVVLHRLAQLERQLEQGLLHINSRLDTLAFVRTETWLEREAARDAALSSMRDDIDGARALGMWAVGLVAGLVLTALVGFLLWMAQGGAG